MITTTLGPVVAWEFPEDAEAGKAAFLAHWDNPVETWVRAYAFTMSALAEAVIKANASAPQHLYVDRSQCQENAEQAVLVRKVIAAGVEVTIGTSPAGAEFIAHSKSYFAANGDCWEGSWNFSESASHQVNTAFQFNSPEWRTMMVSAFNRDVQYAWTNQRAAQLMSQPPASFTS